MTPSHIYAMLSAGELFIYMLPWSTEAWWHHWLDAELLGLSVYFALRAVTIPLTENV